MPSVLNPWVEDLKLMQQSVLLAMVRNSDGIPKHHAQKPLIKWLRRCILKSAFDNRHMMTPDEKGGGNFTGPVEDINAALDEFIWARDEMSHHYFNHAMHAFQILGYKYPDPEYQLFWLRAYLRMVDCCHLRPESEADMDMRLGDHEPGWRAREDCLGGCTATEQTPQGSSEFSFGAEPPMTHQFTAEEEVKQYIIGDETMRRVFVPAGLTNIHDLQAVFDAVEKALKEPRASDMIVLDETPPEEPFRRAFLGEPTVPYNFDVLYLPGMTARERADAVRERRLCMKADSSWNIDQHTMQFQDEIDKQERDANAGANALGSSGRDDIYNR